MLCHPESYGASLLEKVNSGDLSVKRAFELAREFSVAVKLTAPVPADIDFKVLVRQTLVEHDGIHPEYGRIEVWDTSRVTNMESAFKIIHIPDSLQLQWNTSKVTDMRGMFYGCHDYNQPLPSSFDTSNVTNMSGMFYGC